MKNLNLVLIFVGILFFNIDLFSQERLGSNEDGQVLLEIENPTHNFLVGLTPPFEEGEGDILSNVAYTYVISNGNLLILEYGNLITSAGSVVQGDSIIIIRDGSNIRYFKNEINVRTVATNPNYELQIMLVGDDVPEIETSFNRELSAFAYVSNITANDDLNSGIIDVNPEGGDAPYTYQWETGETTKYLNNLAQGKYLVTITDAGGQTIQQEYSIDYFITAAVPNTFVLENNAIKKHPDSTNDSEMMVSENKLSDSDWVEASFSGEDISFVFGLDSRKLIYLNSQEIEFGILTHHNQMYFIKDGNVISELGQYRENQSLMLKREFGMLMVYLDGIQIREYEIGTLELYSKVSLTKDEGYLILWNTSKWWKPSGENDFYASLAKKLDGSFYEMKNYIKFKYKEKYDNDVLVYAVYDWERNVKMSNITNPIIDHSYGINFHRIPAYTILNSQNDGHYILEATNSKGEVYKMRFHFEKEMYGFIPGIMICCPGIGEPVENNVKQKSAIVNPNNPTIVNTNPVTNNERRK